MAAVRGLLAPWIGGVSAPSASVGFRSMLAPWMGGASSGMAPAQAAVRSMLAPWIGGASVSPADHPGYRALLAFWMGGACSPYITPEPPTPDDDSGGVPMQPRRFRIRPRKTDDIHAMTLSILKLVNNE